MWSGQTITVILWNKEMVRTAVLNCLDCIKTCSRKIHKICNSIKHTLALLVTSPVGVVANHCDEYVCLWVRLSAHEDISGTPRAQSLPNFLCMLPVSVVRSSSDMFMIGRIAYHLEGVFFPLKIIYRRGKGGESAQLGLSMLSMLALVTSVLWHTLVPSVHLQTLLSWRRTVSPHQTSKRGSELFDFPDLIQGRREIASSLRRWSCRLRVDLRYTHIKTTSHRSLLTVLFSFSACGMTKPRIMNSLNTAATNRNCTVSVNLWHTFSRNNCHQCFDTVGWASGRAPGM